MANQQYPYNQPPGSSSYYAAPYPMGQYGYPNPNAPAYNPYQPPYPMPPPPVDGMHPIPTHPAPAPDVRSSPRMQAQPSPRMNGAGRGGGYGHRGGGHVYAPPQNYHPAVPMHAPPHYMSPHAQPSPMTHPYQLPPKFPPGAMPYPAYPGTPDGSAYPVGWMAPPALSPLPKQLNALPHFGSNQYSPATYVPPPHPLREESNYANGQLGHAAPQEEAPVPSTAEFTTEEPVVSDDVPNTAAEEAEPTPIASSQPSGSEETEPEPTVQLPASATEEEEQVPDAEEASSELEPTSDTAPPMAVSSSFSFGTASDAEPQPSPSNEEPRTENSAWAVWSERPSNPSLAPGLLFSKRARPPQSVVQMLIGDALADRTPPASPIRAPLTAQSLAQMDSSDGVQEAQPVSTMTDAGISEASVEVLPPASDAATEVGTTSMDSTRTPTPISTPTPRSPVSSFTSISASPAVKVANGIATPPAAAPTPPVASASSETPSAEPVAKAAPKSWASLLHGSSKSSLPTSAVVGFSIPAGIPSGSVTGTPSASNDTILPVAPGQRGELLGLLTRDPAGFAGWAPRIRPRGLVNQGNMCFANAVLQTLVYCPPFHRLFTDLGRLLPGPVVGKDQERKTPLVDATVQFIRDFEMKPPKKQEGKGKEREEMDDDWEVNSFLPTYFYEAMKEKKRFESMRGGQQEDAEEFLGFYLDTLEDELLTILNALQPPASAAAAPSDSAEPGPQDVGWMEVGKKNRVAVTRTAKSTESPITRVFGGKFRSTLRVPHQKDSVMVEDWRALQLDITPEAVHTINDALQQLSHPQTVQVTSPTRAGQTVDAQQTVLIDALPPILVLHLKRFMYDTNVKDVVKIGKKVAFERELEIAPEMMAPSSRKIGRPTKYKLFGVLYHHGLSASGGHYTLDVLHPNRDLSSKPREAWIRIDDELVSDVTPDDVFGGLERDDRCAYLLFYRKIGGGTRP